jgi:hypothetical protein
VILKAFAKKYSLECIKILKVVVKEFNTSIELSFKYIIVAITNISKHNKRRAFFYKLKRSLALYNIILRTP